MAKKTDPIKEVQLPPVEVKAKGKAKRKYGLNKIDNELDQMNKMFSLLGFTDKQYDPISNSWEESSEDWKKVQEIGSILSLPIGSIGTKDKLFKKLSSLVPVEQLSKFLTEKTFLKEAYKHNPWAFKPNESNWYRQVGKPAIDDAIETGLVRERGEEVSPKNWKEFQEQLVRMQGSGLEAAVASRTPASPYFGKGKLFYPMGRKPVSSGKKGRGRDGSSDYLIETTLPNESFQPSYVKGMGLGIPTEIGQTAILKPDPTIRGLENFKLYKQDWLQGYKEIDMSKNLKKYSDGGGLNVDFSKALDFQDTSKMSSNKKFDLNGILGSINEAAPMANIVAQITNWGLSSLDETTYDRPMIQKDANPYKMSHGGTMPGSKSFKGASHEEGGIPVDANGQQSNNPIAEVEGDEFIHKFAFIPNKGNYIFSKKLGTADIAETIVDKYTKMKGHKNPTKDGLVKAAMEFELKNVADLNDMRKAIEEQEQIATQESAQGVGQQAMRLGGILGKLGMKKYELGDPLDDNTQLSDIDLTNAYFNSGIQNPQLRTLTANKLAPSLIKDPNLDYSNYAYDASNSNTRTPVAGSKISGVSDALRTATMIGDAFQTLRPAEKESPILADYSKMRGQMDNMSADLTAAKDAAVGAFNEGNQQIRDGSTSIQSYMTRRMGSTAQKADALAQIASKERELRNSIAGSKASMEGQIAGDDATRKYQNRVDNLQNKAAKEAYLQRLGDNMLKIAKEIDGKKMNEMRYQEGMDFLKFSSELYDVEQDMQTGKMTLTYRKPEEG